PIDSFITFRKAIAAPMIDIESLSRQAAALQSHPTGVTYRPMPAELIASAQRQSVFIPPSALPLT
ncbi:MAG: hypothetical protein DRH70_06990, partial [Candidatus Coatesbacteria bacterium]